MKTFCFTVDDNIRFLKEITERKYNSIFEHPYLAMYKRLHAELGVKVQLNLFYRVDGFDLSQMPDTYYDEWQQNSDWLKLSFHSDYENVKPYEFSGYDEVFCDCKKINDNIVRFASPSALGKTTTVHCCLATKDGLKALADNNVEGLLGLFGDSENPRTSYGIGEQMAQKIRAGESIRCDKITFAAIDIVLNSFSEQIILQKLDALKARDAIKVMIHEQYFYPDYKAYQPEFEDKLRSTFCFLKQNGFESNFFEELL